MHAIVTFTQPVRTLSTAMFLMSISSGIYMSCGVVFFTDVIGLPATEISLGLSGAGIAGVTANILVGRLSDRFGPTRVIVINLATAGLATLGFIVVQGFWGFVATVAVSASTRTSTQVVVGPLVNRLASSHHNEHRARIRSVCNIGMAFGAIGAVAATRFDSRAAYQLLVISGGAFLFASALLASTLPTLKPITTNRRRDQWQVLRDRPFLALTIVDAVLSLQYRILSVTIPLWILEFLHAPSWLAPGVFILNTAIVVVWQVKFGRAIDGPRSAGAALRSAGLAFLTACVLLGSSTWTSGWGTVAVVGLGVCVLSLGELWQTAGGFEAANSLAPPPELGQYLGLFSVGLRVADCAGPVLLAWLCLGFGPAGWFSVGLLLFIAGLAAPGVIRWGIATGGRYHRLHDGTDIMMLNLDATTPIPRIMNQKLRIEHTAIRGRTCNRPRHRRTSRRRKLFQEVLAGVCRHCLLPAKQQRLDSNPRSRSSLRVHDYCLHAAEVTHTSQTSPSSPTRPREDQGPLDHARKSSKRLRR